MLFLTNISFVIKRLKTYFLKLIFRQYVSNQFLKTTTTLYQITKTIIKMIKNHFFIYLIYFLTLIPDDVVSSSSPMFEKITHNTSTGEITFILSKEASKRIHHLFSKYSKKFNNLSNSVLQILYIPLNYFSKC